MRVIFPYEVRDAGKSPLFEGRLHCIARDQNRTSLGGPNNKIVYFDQLTDEFKDIPVPKPKRREENILCGLGLLRGNLCVVCWDNKNDDFDNGGGNYEVMVMKEYGVVESWTFLYTISISNLRNKCYSFSLYYDVVEPICSTRRGGIEVVLNLTSLFSSKVMVYNPSSHSCQKIKILDYEHAATYEQTLNSPKDKDYYWDYKIHSELCRTISAGSSLLF